MKTKKNFNELFDRICSDSKIRNKKMIYVKYHLLIFVVTNIFLILQSQALPWDLKTRNFFLQYLL